MTRHQFFENQKNFKNQKGNFVLIGRHPQMVLTIFGTHKKLMIGRKSIYLLNCFLSAAPIFSKRPMLEAVLPVAFGLVSTITLELTGNPNKSVD